ncbi:MAG: ABC transporter substrate-binding protein [Candidatus Dormibacteria bacterium]
MYSVKTARTAVMSVGLAALVAACGGSGGTGSNGPARASADKQVLRINSGTQPNSLDPGQQSYDYEATIGRQTFEALLKPSKDGKDLVGAAATGKPDVSSDGLTYTFHIRDNNWSDGKPVSAKDFLYGWQRLLNPCLAAGYADPFFDGTVKGAETYGKVDAKDTKACDTFVKGLGMSAKDDKTFVVQLQAAAGWFPYVASLWVGAPVRQDIVEKYGSDKWATVPAQVIGNGKFKVSELVQDDHITLVPNDKYKGDKPQLSKLQAFFIKDSTTALNKYKNGELDIIGVPISSTDALKADPKFGKQIKTFKALNTFWYSYNTKVAPFDKQPVRLAFAKAIDRQKLVKDVSHGQYLAETTFTPEGLAGFTGNDPAFKDIQKYDPTAAKKLLTDAGVTPASLTIKLLTRDSTTNKLVNQFIQDQLQTNLGVKVDLEVIDSKTVTKRLRKGDFQMYGGDGWGMDYGHPQDLYDIQVTSACHGTQWGCYSSKEYDDLVAKADAEKDFNKALDIYKKAEKLILTDAPIGITNQRPNVELIQPWIQGLSGTPLDDPELPGDFYPETIYISSH